jgi:hypothetical protein
MSLACAFARRRKHDDPAKEMVRMQRNRTHRGQRGFGPAEGAAGLGRRCRWFARRGARPPKVTHGKVRHVGTCVAAMGAGAYHRAAALAVGGPAGIHRQIGLKFRAAKAKGREALYSAGFRIRR